MRVPNNNFCPMACPNCLAILEEGMNSCSVCHIEIKEYTQRHGINLFQSIVVTMLLGGVYLLSLFHISAFFFQQSVIMLVALYYAYILFQRKQWKTQWFWILVLTAVLFNPVETFFLPTKVWQFWELIMAILLIFYGLKLRNRHFVYLQALLTKSYK